VFELRLIDTRQPLTPVGPTPANCRNCSAKYSAAQIFGSFPQYSIIQYDRSCDFARNQQIKSTCKRYSLLARHPEFREIRQGPFQRCIHCVEARYWHQTIRHARLDPRSGKASGPCKRKFDDSQLPETWILLPAMKSLLPSFVRHVLRVPGIWIEGRLFVFSRTRLLASATNSCLETQFWKDPYLQNQPCNQKAQYDQCSGH